MPVDDYIQRAISVESLKYFVGMTMFCPACQRVLDYRDAVEVDINDKDGKTVKSAVTCAACYDQRKDAFHQAVEAANKQNPALGLNVQVLDGRILSPKPEIKARGPVVTKPFHKGDIKLNGRYEIHHTSGWITVTVTHIHLGATQWYTCVNEKTGRTIHVKSASKFRREVL